MKSSTWAEPLPSTVLRPGSWRVLRDPPGAAAWNMAVDEALARGWDREEGVLRIYRWARPTLSFGRNQPALDRYDPLAAAALGVEVVRRPTGGREVLHDRELTYSVSAPITGPGELRAAYRILNQALVEALGSLGVPARLATPAGRTPDPGAGACFQAPAEGEVEAEGRKLVGSAQVRIGDRLLQHGSLLLGRPSVELAALRAPGSKGSSRAGDATVGFTTLEDLLGRAVPFDRVAAAVEAGMAGVLGGRWSRGELAAKEREVASELLPQYQSTSWTWRR